MNMGHWRWPLIISIPVLAGTSLVFTGVVRPVYEGHAYLLFSGSANQVDAELEMFRSPPVEPVTMDRVAGHALRIVIRGQGDRPVNVVSRLTAVAKNCV